MNHSLKRPVNVKAREELVADAKALGINLSATFEKALESAGKSARIARWQEQNAEAFAAYDERIAAKGVFSTGHAGIGGHFSKGDRTCNRERDRSAS
jgi:antitoxin CcdA